MDHFEGRGYPGLMRHLILSAVSLLFLARERQMLLGEYPELTVSQVRQAASAMIQSWWLPPKAAAELIKKHGLQNRVPSTTQSAGSRESQQDPTCEAGSDGNRLSKTRRCNWDTG